MRVLTAYYTHKPGGFCKRLYRLMNALVKAGHEVHYCCLDTPPKSLDTTVHVHLIPFPMRRRSGVMFWALFTLWAPLALVFIARKFRPERYVAFSAYYAGILWASRHAQPAKLVLFIRSLVFRIDQINRKASPLRWASNAVDRLGIRTATKVICMTNAMKREVENFIGSTLANAEILPNEIPNSDARATPGGEEIFRLLERLQDKVHEERLIVLTSGVLDARKNIDLLLDVWAELQDTAPLLLVAGDGPLRIALERRAAELGLETIEFLGWHENLDPLYPLIDVVVHPALHEGVSNSVLEAFAHEVPVLCADIPEMREILVSNDLLFDPASPGALVESLKRIIAAPQAELRRLWDASAPARQRLSFDWDNAAVQAATRHDRVHES